MGESNNLLEMLINLIYLARHSADDAAAVERYLAEAEIQTWKLAALYGHITQPLDREESVKAGNVDEEKGAWLAKAISP